MGRLAKEPDNVCDCVADKSSQQVVSCCWKAVLRERERPYCHFSTLTTTMETNWLLCKLDSTPICSSKCARIRFPMATLGFCSPCKSKGFRGQWLWQPVLGKRANRWWKRDLRRWTQWIRPSRLKMPTDRFAWLTQAHEVYKQVKTVGQNYFRFT